MRALYVYPMIRQIILAAIALVLIGASNCSAEPPTLFLTNQCISKNARYLEGAQRFNCVELMLYESESEAYPKADFYVIVQDTHQNAYGRSEICPNAETVVKRLIKKCSLEEQSTITTRK